jgi:ribosomal protein S18 acetylase RimI-like enzyme
MTEALEQARRRGAAVLWLGVWERNPRAIRFYEKCGFADAGSQTFVLGSDPQTDRIMWRSVPNR